MKKALTVAFFALTGCGEEANGRMMFAQPSQMDAEGLATLEGLPLLAGMEGRSYGVCNHFAINRDGMTSADLAIYRKVFSQSSLTSRDIELMESDSWGTGQSLLGLTCVLGYLPQINRAFYLGVGHQWQVVTNNNRSFIYLQGDGTETGMRVTSWN